MDAAGLVKLLANKIVNPIIVLLVAIAVLIFLWGVAEFIRGADSESARDTGKKHMMWGLIGLFIMISAYAILRVFTTSIYG